MSNTSHLKLSHEEKALTKLSHFKLLAAIRDRRRVIRNHRDQKGDDRCWVDDWSIWEMLDDTPNEPETPPPFDEAMRLCRDFWTYRNASSSDLTPANALTYASKWDDDLPTMTTPQLLKELADLQKAIQAHRDIKGRPRTIDDDRRLYEVLPEKIPADFRLPSEDAFLGETRAPKAGCPSFWRSHQQCQTTCHNLHAWGPCHSDPPNQSLS